LEESQICPEIEVCVLATDETESNIGTVRHGDFYSVSVEVIKGSGFVISRKSCVEAGSNISTVALGVVGRDEK
jgi:hypothetical protein